MAGTISSVSQTGISRLKSRERIETPVDFTCQSGSDVSPG